MKWIKCPKCNGEGCQFCGGTGNRELKPVYDLARRKIEMKNPNVIKRLEEELEELLQEIRVFNLNRTPEAMKLVKGEIEDVLFWAACLEVKEFGEGAYEEGINRKGLSRFPEEM